MSNMRLCDKSKIRKHLSRILLLMEQLEGFKVKDKIDMVYKLKKSLYGLKQAPRQ